MTNKKYAGVDVLLEVQNEQGEYVVVGGQTGASLAREFEEIDTTDKTTGGWKSSIPGVGSWAVEGEGFVVLGDSAGSFDLIEDAFMERREVKVNLRMGKDSDEYGQSYSGFGYIYDLPLEFAKDDAVTFSLTINGNDKLNRIKGAVNTTPAVEEPVEEPVDGNTDYDAPTIVLVDETYVEAELGTRLRFEIRDADSGVATVYGIGGASYGYDGDLIIHEEMVYSNGLYTIQAEDNAGNMSDVFEFEVMTIPA